MCIIKAEKINHTYGYSSNVSRSLSDISLTIHSGELISIIGHNGCGKSTLAKHFNALLPLQDGNLTVASIDASSRAEIWKLRRKVGMVFQNPDNQFVSSIVEEDVAFGLENYETAPSEIPEKVSAALTAVGMTGYEKHSPHMLSGGQKQRIALAGILALEPDILIFDEATTMLDPEGRNDVLTMIHTLHHTGRTIINITHYMEECIASDRICLMKNGHILAFGTPLEILYNREILAESGLYPPLPVQIYYDLKENGITLPEKPLTAEKLVEVLCQLK